MKSFEQYIEEQEMLQEQLTRTDIKMVEKYADKLFAAVGVDVDLSGTHFRERVNDTRNGNDITLVELMGLFKKTFAKHGKKIGGMKPGIEAVINDVNSDINIPFMIKYDKRNDELDVIAKTIMRKKDYKTSNSKLRV
ncbi:hypothetical protein GD1_42 [Paraglaciecola Antarctic GD virus 1]|nr:hypothetical protein GD1_42 [Paraglaciecola Antarctic GD virus 1]